MAKFNVTTPAPGHTGAVGKVHFVDGVAEVDGDANAAELAYFRAQGYGVEEAEAPAPKRRTPAKPKAEDAKTGDGDDKGGAKTADDGQAAGKEDSK